VLTVLGAEVSSFDNVIEENKWCVEQRITYFPCYIGF